jgi:hypothetical protein
VRWWAGETQHIQIPQPLSAKVSKGKQKKNAGRAAAKQIPLDAEKELKGTQEKRGANFNFCVKKAKHTKPKARAKKQRKGTQKSRAAIE